MELTPYWTDCYIEIVDKYDLYNNSNYFEVIKSLHEGKTLYGYQLNPIKLSCNIEVSMVKGLFGMFAKAIPKMERTTTTSTVQ